LFLVIRVRNLCNLFPQPVYASQVSDDDDEEEIDAAMDEAVMAIEIEEREAAIAEQAAAQTVE